MQMLIGSIVSFTSHCFCRSQMATRFRFPGRVFCSSKDMVQLNRILDPATGLVDNKTKTWTGNEKLARDNKRKFGDRRRSATRIRHSYLKLVLESTIWDDLHQLIWSIRDQRSNLLAVEADLDSQTNDSVYTITSTIERAKKIPNLKPRSKQSLHLTFFFGGQIFCSLPMEELVQMHTDLKERVTRTTELASHLTNEAFIVSLKRLRLFPPGRNSLIVAEFDVSPPLQRLHEDVVNIALSSETTNHMLAEVAQGQHKKWLAHVTLADIPRCWGERELDGLDHLLKQTDHKICSHVYGLTMGGPKPQQFDLDWDFYFPLGSNTFYEKI